MSKWKQTTYFDQPALDRSHKDVSSQVRQMELDDKEFMSRFEGVIRYYKEDDKFIVEEYIQSLGEWDKRDLYEINRRGLRFCDDDLCSESVILEAILNNEKKEVLNNKNKSKQDYGNMGKSSVHIMVSNELLTIMQETGLSRSACMNLALRSFLKEKGLL